MGDITLHRVRDHLDPLIVARGQGQQLVTSLAATSLGASGPAVATGSAEGAVEVWRVVGDTFVQQVAPTPVSTIDLALAFVQVDELARPDLQIIGGDARGQLWLIDAGSETISAPKFSWKTRDVPLTAVAARRDGEHVRVAAGSLDGEISFWSLLPGQAPTLITSLQLGSQVAAIGLGKQHDVAIWCRHGAVTLTVASF
jgi:hypothetical protein